MKKIILIFIMAIIISGCDIVNVKYKTNVDDVKEVMEDRYSKIINENNYIVVDVRTADEYSESHVAGSINIPYDEIDENVSLDKTKTIMVYCRSGKRSSIAYDTLTSLGFDVYDLGAYNTVDLPKE